MGTREMRAAWDDYRCLPGTSLERPIRLLGMNAGVCATPTYDGFIALGSALIATNYTDVKSVWIPRNCPTGIAGRTCQEDGDNCSLHNYGIAVDIDPFGYGNNHFFKAFGNGWDFSDCKITREQVEAVEGIKNIQGEQMFRWLGWLIGDTMHFEFIVPPTRTQVDYSTVKGAGIMPLLPLESGDGYGSVPDQTWARKKAGTDQSHKQEDVRRHQDRLNKLPGDDLTLDGLYGPATIARSKEVGGGWTGYSEGQEGRWWGGNQDGELDWAIAKQVLAGVDVGSGFTKEEADQLYKGKDELPAPHGHRYAKESHDHGNQFSKPGHEHEATVTEETKVRLT